MTRFGTVTPAVQLRLEARGRVAPAGYTVKKQAAVVRVAVTFKATAVTPVVGIPPTPVTWTSRLSSGPNVAPALVWPLPGPVSVMRAGTTGTYCPDVPPVD